MIGPARKTGEDILQEELLQERAQVLGRAGESVARALEKLRASGRIIDELLWQQRRDGHTGTASGGDAEEPFSSGLRLVQEINAEIRRFNALREEAKVRYYYLIVTREAMGLRRHHYVEELYGIPPRRRCLRE